VGAADGLGGGADGETGGGRNWGDRLLEVTGDGFTAVGGDGEHAAAVSATRPATSQNHRWSTSQTSDDLTWGLSEGNALD
jgi:hypothetical protein